MTHANPEPSPQKGHEQFGPGDEAWSHVTETITMLYLAVCQIQSTLQDSDGPVNNLTNAFTQLAQHSKEVNEQIQSLEKPEQISSFKQEVADLATEMHQNVNNSVFAFQFYDRVCQRLNHVSGSLEKLTEILQHDKDIASQEAWRRIQYDIKSSYTMEAERRMFDFIIKGGNIQEALKVYKQHEENKSSAADDDDIELF